MLKRNEINADLIEVTVNGVLKTENVFTAADTVMGVLQLNTTKGEGWFRGADGSKLHIKKQSFWKSDTQISDQNGVLGEAESIKPLSRKMSLEFEGQQLTLVPLGVFNRGWRVLARDGYPVLDILPRKGFKRGAVLQVRSEAPLGLVVFAFGLVSRRWQEESAAAA